MQSSFVGEDMPSSEEEEGVFFKDYEGATVIGE